MTTNITLTPVAKTLPTSIQQLVQLGIQTVNPQKVWLYGSRARGDARKNSDYDLAFVFSEDKRQDWIRFLVDLDELVITLLPVDLLDWNTAPEALKQKIVQEGIVLYERITK